MSATPASAPSPAAFALSEEGERRAHAIVVRYPHALAATLPLLWLVQEEKGWISAAAMEWVAARVGSSAAAVQAVVTFYTMFDDAPVGRWKLQVCRTLSCELMGARAIVDRLRDRLGIEPGETTPDGLFTLQEVECLGSCGTAPMMQVNLKFHEHLTPDRVDALLDDLRARTPAWDDVEPVIHPRPTDAEYAAMWPKRTGSAVRPETGGAAQEAQ